MASANLTSSWLEARRNPVQSINVIGALTVTPRLICASAPTTPTGRGTSAYPRSFSRSEPGNVSPRSATSMSSDVNNLLASAKASLYAEKALRDTGSPRSTMLLPFTSIFDNEFDFTDIDDVVLQQEPVVGQRLKCRIDGVILRSTLDTSADSEIVAHLPIDTEVRVIQTLAVVSDRGGKVRVKVQTVEDAEHVDGVSRIGLGWCTLATARGTIFLAPSPEEV
eukprot:GEMP01029271.1.p1 GENE.GEMP01029271.1~~GEMP01029271.1.p1  ORF type:complete len:223 (+),score=35.83 GEMP01029271.1:143-811(+)